jgi:hypothetical protein
MARIWLRAMDFVAPCHITILICRRRAEALIIEPSTRPTSPSNAKSGLKSFFGKDTTFPINNIGRFSKNFSSFLNLLKPIKKLITY